MTSITRPRSVLVADIPLPIPTSPVQHVVRNNANGHYFFSQNVAEASDGVETNVIVETDSSGKELGRQVRKNAGHGTVIWFEISDGKELVGGSFASTNPTGDVTRYDLVRIPFKTETVIRSKIFASNVVPNLGGKYVLASLDIANSKFVLRTKSGTNEIFKQYEKEDVLDGINKPINATIVIPKGPATMQGYTSYGPNLFYLAGNVNGTNGPVTISVYNFVTGRKTLTIDLNHLGRDYTGYPIGGRLEAEGVSISRYADGRICLLLNIMVGKSGKFRSRLYEIELSDLLL